MPLSLIAGCGSLGSKNWSQAFAITGYISHRCGRLLLNSSLWNFFNSTTLEWCQHTRTHTGFRVCFFLFIDEHTMFSGDSALFSHPGITKRRKNPDESNYLHLLHLPPWHCPFSLQHHPPLQQSQKQMLLFTADPMRCQSFQKVHFFSRQYTSFFPRVLEVLKMFFLTWDEPLCFFWPTEVFTSNSQVDTISLQSFSDC